MCRRFLNFLLRFSVISVCSSLNRRNFSLLIDFTCAVAKDELEKHPEMRKIAMVELENNFPSEFSSKVLKCLPEDVAKVQMKPHMHGFNNSLVLPEETLAIYVADVIKRNQLFLYWRYYFNKNFPGINHLSKYLIVSSDKARTKISEFFFNDLLNSVHIYEGNGKVIAESFNRIKKETTLKTFEDSQHENLSRILFPDKVNNLDRKQIHAAYIDDENSAHKYEGSDRPNCKWNFYLDIIAEKLNAIVSFVEVPQNHTSAAAYFYTRDVWMKKLMREGKLDFYLYYGDIKVDLESYNSEAWCFLVPLPKPFDLTDLILILPLDPSCWMWLGITIAISNFVWRISEGHWSFPFGAFSYFVGQSAEIRTSHRMLQTLRRLFIFSLFIFSNGYQSLVTSFMLNPAHLPVLKSIDELLESDLKINTDFIFEELQKDNPKYQKAVDGGRIVDFDSVSGNWIKKMIEINLAYSQPCKSAMNWIEIEGDGKNWFGLYLIPESIYSEPDDLYIRPFHPYLDKFQEIMDRSLEVGLPIAWERFYREILRETHFNGREKEEANDMLDFGLIAPLFLILAFGFSIALFALLCEIFWHDFVMELTREYFKKKFDEIMKREIKVKKVKIKKKTKKVKKVKQAPESSENSE